MASLVRLPLAVFLSLLRTVYDITTTLLPFLPQLPGRASIRAADSRHTPFLAQMARYAAGGEDADQTERRPSFFAGSYKQLLETVKRDLRFAVVYLHAPEHDDTDRFCREVLFSRELISFLRHPSILLWGASMQDADGFEVSNALFASGFPFLAILAVVNTTGVAKVTVVDRIDGSIQSARQLVTRLQGTLDKHRTYADSMRTEREERELARSIRDQQDQAYQESLRRDRERQQTQEQEQKQKKLEEKLERDTAARLEERLMKRKQQREQLRTKFAQSSSIELDSSSNAVLQFVFPNGSRHRRKFPLDAHVSVLYEYVESLDPFDMDHTTADRIDSDTFAIWDASGYDFLLASVYPRVEHTNHNMLLKDAGIESGVSLVVERH